MRSIVLSSVLFFAISFSFAQTSGTSILAAGYGLETANARLNLIDGQLKAVIGVENNDPASNVYISQIGDENQVFVFADSENNLSNINQNGDYNNVGLYLQAESIKYEISQIGDNHMYLHFDKSNPQLIEVNALQKGDGTDIVIHGKNSISERMKIKIQGNDRSLIIRNFN